MKLVTDIKEIRYCQQQLEKILKGSLTAMGEHNIGFPGGNMFHHVWSNSDFWYTSFEITDEMESVPRFWNAFGVASELSDKKSNNIAVEINIPTQGINRMVAGFFATTPNNKEIFLFHRGRIGGGRAGIGKKAFLGWYPDNTIEVEGKNNSIDNGILVGEINSKSFLDDLAKFIKNVALFRVIATSGEIDQSTYMSDEELRKKAEQEATKKPKKKKIKSDVFERNPYISELAKRRAKGKCQLCLSSAPFLTKLGRPYLESHHVVWLANGGEDTIENTVALCPNCHKKMHVLNLGEDVTKLNKIAAKS